MNPAIKRLLQAAREGANGVARTLEPDGDWMPMLLSENGSELSIVMLPTELFANDDGKEVLAGVVIPYLAWRVKAQALCMISSTWVRKEPEGGEEREEAVTVVAVDEDSAVLQMGYIVRDGERVRLEWSEMMGDNGDEAVIDGRFPDALRKALSIDGSLFEGIDLGLDLRTLDLNQLDFEGKS